MKDEIKDKIIEIQGEYIEELSKSFENRNYGKRPEIMYECYRKYTHIISNLKSQLSEAGGEKEEEFHVWVIPVKYEIFVEDRGGGIPFGATEHIVFDTWEGALKLGQFLAKFCGYELELDNEAGRFAEFEEQPR